MRGIWIYRVLLCKFRICEVGLGRNQGGSKSIEVRGFEDETSQHCTLKIEGKERVLESF